MKTKLLTACALVSVLGTRQFAASAAGANFVTGAATAEFWWVMHALRDSLPEPASVLL